jgi:predicted 3-demethylubiquinone-9 3-methyltransferase (glyoxalase superfamily)
MKSKTGVTPFITLCGDSEEEFDHLFGNFADRGFVVMGPEPIMNLRKVAWVTDRFKITWQLVWG